MQGGDPFHLELLGSFLGPGRDLIEKGHQAGFRNELDGLRVKRGNISATNDAEADLRQG